MGVNYFLGAVNISKSFDNTLNPKIAKIMNETPEHAKRVKNSASFFPYAKLAMNENTPIPAQASRKYVIFLFIVVIP